MRRAPTKRFLFKLAKELGWWNPYALARQMPAKLLVEWQAYLALEPTVAERADYHAAQIAQMLYNINRDPKKDPNGKKLQDFVLEFDKEEPTEEERQKALDSKMKAMELIMRAQSEAAAEQQAKAPPKVIEHTYPSLDAIGTNGGKVSLEVLKPSMEESSSSEQEAIAKARAAMK